MKHLARSRWIAPLTLAVLALGLTVGRGTTQDPDSKETNYGQKELKAGFEPDPLIVNVDAGGPIETNLGGVRAWVDKQPDYRIQYTAGKYPLSFYVNSGADTTLLINLPDGKWLANDDGPGTGLNPFIKINQPQSGRYEIWVGTVAKGQTPPSKLYIPETKGAQASRIQGRARQTPGPSCMKISISGNRHCFA